ncbi:rhamnan synthesis F family protein [Anaerocolumna jejuensis]|uniref:rhamnan synthesis F family protein n=1 Tax=Anaerocolumna jejuensis TaxID=259063 RepID=UPI003F7C438B
MGENQITKKRIGIFCYYDREGIVDQYIDFLLDDLCKCLNKLIIVINGLVSNEGMTIFEKYSNEIYIRENCGFDGGAYKDVIIFELGDLRIQEYDEIVLCNDTFYGPFASFEMIFKEMESKDADFWGMNYVSNQITNHLQSYFLVFRKKIIKNSYLFKYFTYNIDSSTKNIFDIYADFEFGLFYYLYKQGCSFDSYSLNNICDIYKSSNACIRDYKLPILKKRAFSPNKIVVSNVIDALKYIDEIGYYNIELILESINRIYNLSFTKKYIMDYKIDRENIRTFLYDISKISDIDIKSLIYLNQKIFIYGLGAHAIRIAKVFEYYNYKIAGYIVSDNQKNIPQTKNGIHVYRISEIIKTDVIIIVAINKEYTREVSQYLGIYSNVIYLW